MENENPYRIGTSHKKSFTFEDGLRSAVERFISDDRKKRGDLNFGPEYFDNIRLYTKMFTDHFCGRRYRLSLSESDPGSGAWRNSASCDVNFGQIWENAAASFLKEITADFKGWPNGTMEFPDFSVGGVPGDFKAVLSGLYSNSKVNIAKGLAGYLKPGGHGGLYCLDDYTADVKEYKETGRLSDHLKCIIIFAVYEYRYDEVTGAKHAVVHNVVVAPALFFVNFNLDGTPSMRNDEVTIGFLERNYVNIMSGNFGVLL